MVFYGTVEILSLMPRWSVVWSWKKPEQPEKLLTFGHCILNHPWADCLDISEMILNRVWNSITSFNHRRTDRFNIGERILTWGGKLHYCTPPSQNWPPRYKRKIITRAQDSITPLHHCKTDRLDISEKSWQGRKTPLLLSTIAERILTLR